jgi:hypothetical protein
MIIIEGPDGSGKTTLVHDLQRDTSLPLHPRFVNSDGTLTNGDANKPRSVLFDRAWHDACTLRQQPISIYDRHPLVSEYVYGPIVRGELPEGFESGKARDAVYTMATQSLVVLCRPPLRSLISSVMANKQMDGVIQRLGAIRAGYDILGTFWPEEMFIYNRENPNAYERLLKAVQDHITAELMARQCVSVQEAIIPEGV